MSIKLRILLSIIIMAISGSTIGVLASFFTVECLHGRMGEQAKMQKLLGQIQTQADIVAEYKYRLISLMTSFSGESFDTWMPGDKLAYSTNVEAYSEAVKQYNALAKVYNEKALTMDMGVLQKHVETLKDPELPR